MHAGHRGHAQLGLDRRAERAARHAVAAGEEGGPGDHEIGRSAATSASDLADGALGLLGDVVVAADHRRHHGARVAQRLLDGARRADGAGPHLGPDAGALLAAELAEELVDVADDAQRLGRPITAPPAITLRSLPDLLDRAAERRRTSTRVAPRSRRRQSSAPIARSIAGTSTGSCAPPTFTSASRPGKSNSSMPSALPSVDMSSTISRRLHAERLALRGGLRHVDVRRAAADLGEDRAVGAEHVRHEPGGE